MFARILVASAILNPALSWALVPYLAPPLAVTAAGALWRSRGRTAPDGETADPANPLELRSALQMAGIFQVVLFVVHEVGLAYGGAGLAATGALLGLTDIDALTISMSHTAVQPDQRHAAALAIAVGVLTSALLKLGVTTIVGRGSVRTLAGGVLAASAAASLAALIWLR
jgi:uncharacterized membrane protein (DUF4010 family)